jgi:hypothetical protein
MNKLYSEKLETKVRRMVSSHIDKLSTSDGGYHIILKDEESLIYETLEIINDILNKHTNKEE